MDDYTIRTLSEDGEVLNSEEVLVVSEFDPYLSVAFTSQANAASGALKFQPEFGAMTVQAVRQSDDYVLWEETFVPSN